MLLLPSTFLLAVQPLLPVDKETQRLPARKAKQLVHRRRQSGRRRRGGRTTITNFGRFERPVLVATPTRILPERKSCFPLLFRRTRPGSLCRADRVDPRGSKHVRASVDRNAHQRRSVWVVRSDLRQLKLFQARRWRRRAVVRRTGGFVLRNESQRRGTSAAARPSRVFCGGTALAALYAIGDRRVGGWSSHGGNRRKVSRLIRSSGRGREAGVRVKDDISMKQASPCAARQYTRICVERTGNTGDVH